MPSYLPKRVEELCPHHNALLRILDRRKQVYNSGTIGRPQRVAMRRGKRPAASRPFHPSAGRRASARVKGWILMDGCNLLRRLCREDTLEIESITSSASSVVTMIKRLLEAVKADDPRSAVFPIEGIAKRYGQGMTLLSKWDISQHIISRVAEPVETPGTCEPIRGIGSIRIPTLTATFTSPSAHRGALWLHDVFSYYLCEKAWHHFPRLGLGFNERTAADLLTQQKWEEIQSELEAVSSFDCDRLRIAIELEGDRAIERCRYEVMKVAASAGDVAESYTSEVSSTIPREFPTRFMTKREAAKFLNGGAVANASTYISDMVSRQRITAPVGSGKKWQFDWRQFPTSVQSKVQ
jgi:hypothetical protein